MWNRESRFTVLVKAYTDDLYRFAVWLCRDTEVARDLVQETFARAWKSLDSLQDERAAKSWLITTLRRENARRFERNQLQTSNRDVEEIVDSNKFYDTSIEAHMLRRELSKLDKKYLEPLLLQFIGGYTTLEISRELGISQSAVLSRVFRARQKLRAALGGDIKEKNMVNQT